MAMIASGPLTKEESIGLESGFNETAWLKRLQEIDPQKNLISRIYCDGGLIGGNPSLIGGTWAVRALAFDGTVMIEKSGIVIPRNAEYPPAGVVARDRWYRVDLDTVTNNITELCAAIQAANLLPPEWEGMFYSDSKLTLRRMFTGIIKGNKNERYYERGNAPFNAVPESMKQEALQARARLGEDVRAVLLDGHPDAVQLESCIGKRGNECSAHNHWCDVEAGRIGKVYKKYLESKGS